MEAKRINSFAAGAGVYWKQRHHGVESKGVGEKILIASVEVSAWDGRGIEGEAHVWKARANELSVDSRVV